MFHLSGERDCLTDKIDKFSLDFLGRKYHKFTYAVRSVNALTDGKCEYLTYKELRDKLLNDLNRLTRALEIYLIDYVGKLNHTVLSPDIQKIAYKINEYSGGSMSVDPCKVISFNYTNTFQVLYDKQKKCEYDYIHGKADEGNTTETNNMVLGIDEYLSSDRKSRDIEFIAFKKYYQRIYKQNGCKYKLWIDKIGHEYEEFIQRKKEAVDREHRYTEDSMQRMINQLAASALKDEKCDIHNLYVFGHSLDITDGDILRALIVNDNVHTTIFYHSKAAMGQQIANLVKVIGQDELIKRSGGITKTIEFVPQQAMVSI